MLDSHRLLTNERGTIQTSLTTGEYIIITIHCYRSTLLGESFRWSPHEACYAIYLAMPSIARTTCLICGSLQVQPLLSLSERGTPHRTVTHNSVYEYSVLGVCANCGHGQLEIYSHDCFGHPADEDWDMYWWYAITPDDVFRLSAKIKSCPGRLNAQCTCTVHQTLRKSTGTLWGGVKHAFVISGKTSFAWLRLIESAETMTLMVDKKKGVGQSA